MKKILFCSLFYFSSFLCFSQSPRIADFFVRDTNDNEVLVVWVTEAGSTCPSLSIERGVDGVNFSIVYTYPSVCGNSNEQITYSWVDSKANLYAENYYRVNLDDVEFTLPELIDLQSNLANDNALISPNPNSGNITLDHRNSNNLNYSISIFRNDGALLMQLENQSGRSVNFETPSLENGYYIARINYSDGSTETVNFSISK